MLEGSVKWLSETCGSNSFGRQWAAGRQPPGGYNVYNYMVFLHFTYPYPDYFVTAGAPTLVRHTAGTLFSSCPASSSYAPTHHAIILAHASQSRHLLHTASCSLQEVQAVRTLSLSYPAMYPAGSCCNCAPHVIPSAWSGPVHLSHTATRSRRSQASASQYPVSCRFPADSCFRLVLHAERSP